MLALEISPPANADLQHIWFYIAQDQPANANRYLDRLQEMAQKLAEFPHLGRDRPELAPGLRSFPVGRYNLYYRISDQKLELVRVLAADLDVSRILWVV